MPHISAMRESKYLKQSDLPKPILVTIKDVNQENLAMEGQSIEFKWIIHFVENVKPMVLNSTNAQIIAGITGSEITEDWQNHKIVLYADPNISFQGKLVGGIRARAPRNQAPPPPVTAPPPAATPPPAAAPGEWAEPDDGSDVPF